MVNEPSVFELLRFDCISADCISEMLTLEIKCNSDKQIKAVGVLRLLKRLIVKRM